MDEISLSVALSRQLREQSNIDDFIAEIGRLCAQKEDARKQARTIEMAMFMSMMAIFERRDPFFTRLHEMDCATQGQLSMGAMLGLFCMAFGENESDVVHQAKRYFSFLRNQAVKDSQRWFSKKISRQWSKWSKSDHMVAAKALVALRGIGVKNFNHVFGHAMKNGVIRDLTRVKGVCRALKMAFHKPMAAIIVRGKKEDRTYSAGAFDRMPEILARGKASVISTAFDMVMFKLDDTIWIASRMHDIMAVVEKVETVKDGEMRMMQAFI